jgi:hypothetical protein
MMMGIIDLFDHINDFVFTCEHFFQGDYFEFFIEKLHLYYSKDISYRLAMNHFTFQQGKEYQHIRMSIGGPKTKTLLCIKINL